MGTVDEDGLDDGQQAVDWVRRRGGAQRRARRVLASAHLSGRWDAPPVSVLLAQVEAGAVEAASAGLRRLPPPVELTSDQRRVWRRAVTAAEAAMRRAAADLVAGAEPRVPAAGVPQFGLDGVGSQNQP